MHLLLSSDRVKIDFWDKGCDDVSWMELLKYCPMVGSGISGAGLFGFC
jgi:hypothetical protein